MAKLGYSVKRFGKEQEPVVIIDDFYSDPEALLKDADSKSYQKLGPFYPGIRAQANPAYLGERMALLKEVLINVFNMQNGAALTECAYSIVTARPENLLPIQSLPHYDGLDDGRLALLHYLSEPETGGTAFYRHRRTGFETIHQNRFEVYKDTLQDEAKLFGLPKRDYFREDTEQFERIGIIDAAFNRCILYRGITLHSGYIPKNLPFSSNPRTGRLTVNSFLQKK